MVVGLVLVVIGGADSVLLFFSCYFCSCCRRLFRVGVAITIYNLMLLVVVVVVV